jgi:transcriptional regulator with XRE-family HTH domain
MNAVDKIDQHVARQLRLRRSLVGISPKTLGNTIGLSYQKMHALEKVESPVTAGYLFELGKTLNVPVTYFYEGLYKNAPLETALQKLSDLPAAFFEDNFFIQPENFELLGTYHKIENMQIRQNMLSLMKSIAEQHAL